MPDHCVVPYQTGWAENNIEKRKLARQIKDLAITIFRRTGHRLEYRPQSLSEIEHRLVIRPSGQLIITVVKQMLLHMLFEAENSGVPLKSRQRVPRNLSAPNR